MSEAEPTRPCWRKSSKSAATNCVEVVALSNSILVRDSKDPHGPAMRFDRGDWSMFISLLKTTSPT